MALCQLSIRRIRCPLFYLNPICFPVVVFYQPSFIYVSYEQRTHIQVSMQDSSVSCIVFDIFLGNASVDSLSIDICRIMWYLLSHLLDPHKEANMNFSFYFIFTANPSLPLSLASSLPLSLTHCIAFCLFFKGFLCAGSIGDYCAKKVYPFYWNRLAVDPSKQRLNGVVFIGLEDMVFS